MPRKNRTKINNADVVVVIIEGGTVIGVRNRNGETMNHVEIDYDVFGCPVCGEEGVIFQEDAGRSYKKCPSCTYDEKKSNAHEAAIKLHDSW